MCSFVGRWTCSRWFKISCCHEINRLDVNKMLIGTKRKNKRRQEKKEKYSKATKSRNTYSCHKKEFWFERPTQGLLPLPPKPRNYCFQNFLGWPCNPRALLPKSCNLSTSITRVLWQHMRTCISRIQGSASQHSQLRAEERIPAIHPFPNQSPKPKPTIFHISA